jgi:hypothetical protein
MWRRKPSEPTPRVDRDKPPVTVLSDGEVLWSIDNRTYLPIKVIAYVTKTAAAEREAVAAWADDAYLATRTFSDEMIYKQPNGHWITSNREFMSVDKADGVERARAALAKEYAHLNAIRAEIDAIEATF